MFDETLLKVANALVDHCRNETEAEGLNTLYADDAVSVEALPMGEMGPETAGLDGIRGKHAWWEEQNETKTHSVTGPFLHGNDRFSLIFDAEITEKATGNTVQMKEVAVYTVANGKIVREEFYYSTDE